MKSDPKTAQTYSLAFRKALVDEALNRTPTGGFPELEKRHQLKPGTLFGWVDELGPTPPPAPFSALHFWIGNTTLNEEAFGQYFAYSDDYWALEVEDIESASHDVTGCGFCQDICSPYLYDEDLLLVIWLPQAVSIAEIVGHSTLASEESLAQIIQACASQGLHQANAMFVYADPTQLITAPDKRYNGLSYLGLFDD
ncbi:immunity 22 family protein [Comamonas sp. Y33R10-2]|uniref:immunity 22 family protein n=1 Tax=Comamonas sp. Y33R10-2 TaxID=2853257 RepID=UPI001C5CC088|nr:immunity 22 family protein [Comamonas sp. Y33R10-2]QXZ09507.1 immunity 22 family protein [Comamonas sp. Y33R10-2]